MAHRSAASEGVAGRSQWSSVQGGEVGVRKGVKLPSLTGPANVGTFLCWRNRLLTLSQSHLRREKEPRPRKDRLVEAPRLWLPSASDLLCGRPSLAGPSTWDQRKAWESQWPQARAGQTAGNKGADRECVWGGWGWG